jgi:hypothetical protein
MKLFAAFLVITPAMLGVAHAEGGNRGSETQQSIYDVARGDFPEAGLYEGRAATEGPAPMSDPSLQAGNPGDPEYFRQETNNRE